MRDRQTFYFSNVTTDRQKERQTGRQTIEGQTDTILMQLYSQQVNPIIVRGEFEIKTGIKIFLTAYS
jgi:hypothetical protein